MSAQDLIGFHQHYKRNPLHADSVRLGRDVLHGQGEINPASFIAREYGRKCGVLCGGKGIE